MIQLIKKLFPPYFKINTIETCYNSVAQTNTTELFINFSKK